MVTYFLNSLSAYEQAKKQIRTGLFNDLQICYYHGEPIQSDLENLIHLPLENIYDFMCETDYGLIEEITVNDTSNMELNNKIKTYIDTAQKEAVAKRAEFEKLYKEEIRKIKLDFNEPLRIFFLTSRITTVLQHTAKGLMNAFMNLGYETFLSIEKNDMQRWGSNQNSGYFAWHLKNMFEFKPHIVVNIDYLHNDFLPKEMFNFIWFQDDAPFMYENKQIELRKRDFVFHLTSGLRERLSKVGIESEYQEFLMNGNIFKPRVEIKKEKKIVFIGTSYFYASEHLRHDRMFEEIFNDVLCSFEEKSCITSGKNGDIEYFAKKYNKPKDYIDLVYNYLLRDYCIEKLCRINTGEYKVEIYGAGWEKNQYVKKFHKGMAPYGEEVSKLYNSATYAYCVGGYVLMQRTLESAFSGTIPLVLDVRAGGEDEYDKKVEDGLEFFHIKDLENILTSGIVKEKDFSFIRQEYSYEKMAKRIIDKVQKELS